MKPGMLPRGSPVHSESFVFKEIRGCLTKRSPHIITTHPLPFADLPGAAVLVSVRQMCDHIVDGVMFGALIFSRGCRAKPIAGTLRFLLRWVGISRAVSLLIRLAILVPPFSGQTVEPLTHRSQVSTVCKTVFLIIKFIVYYCSYTSEVLKEYHGFSVHPIKNWTQASEFY
jgi:hypothetical protein